MTGPAAGIRLVGLTGYAGAGKDEAARGLLAVGWTRRAFADPLKALMLAVRRDIRREVTYRGWGEAKADPEVRQALQNLGRAARHHLGDDVWIRALLTTLPDDRPTVVTDVRYPNEAEAIRDRGGLIIRIVRPGVQPVNDHESETAMDCWPVDVTLSNDSSPDHLHRLIRLVVKHGRERTP